MAKDQIEETAVPLTGPARKRAKLPTLLELGWLTPDPALTRKATHPSFARNRFDNYEPVPPALAQYLDEQGYVPDGFQSTLFASKFGVPLHADDELSVLWTLRGLNRQQSLQFIVGKESIFLYPGQVLIFNARQNHAVLAAADGVWAAFSAYVSLKRT